MNKKTPDPQLEHGYTKIANELYDAITRWHLSSYEYRILIFIIRKTYGWNKKEDWISLSQFSEGTNIRKPHVSRSLSLLIKQNIVTKGGKRTNPKYSIQKRYNLWVKLPKGVRSHHQAQVLPKGVRAVTKGGNPVLPKGVIHTYTKETLTKDTIQKTEKTKISSKVKEIEKEVGEILEHWNKIHHTKYIAVKPLVSNLTYWRDMYSVEQIKSAITNIAFDDFWKNKMTPIIFFRRRNPNQEAVDHIGSMLNYKSDLDDKGFMKTGYKNVDDL